MTTARTEFQALYSQARHFQRNKMLPGEFLKGNGFDLYLGDTEVVVGRPGQGSPRSAYYMSMLGGRGTIYFRQYVLESSRQEPRVPLPR